MQATSLATSQATMQAVSPAKQPAQQSTSAASLLGGMASLAVSTSSAPPRPQSVPFLLAPQDVAATLARKIQGDGITLLDRQKRPIPADQIQTLFTTMLCEQAGYPLSKEHLEVLAEIQKNKAKLTINERINDLTGLHKKAPLGTRPLYSPKYPYARALKNALQYLYVGAYKRNWTEWFKMIHKDATYIPSDTEVWNGRKQIKEKLRGQLEILPKLTYEIEWLHVEGSQAVFSILNVLKPKDAEPVSFRNISVIYFEAEPEGDQVVLEADILDMGESKKRVIQYLGEDFFHGGTATWHAIAAGLKAWV